MNASWSPIVYVDIIGSVLTLIIAAWSAVVARDWSSRKQDDIFRQYIFLLTLAIIFFAISRSFGHLFKQILLLNDMAATWNKISPFSGAINSTAFVVIFSFGIYFHRFQRIHLEMEKHKFRLEQMVAERTAELEEKNVALSSEISDREYAETELLKSKNTLETVLNSSIPIAITNLDFEVILANQAYYDKWPAPDLPEGELQKCYVSRPGTLCHTDQCPLKQIISGKENLIVEVKKGEMDSQKDFIITAQPYKNEEGELLGVVESFQDITEWKAVIEEKNKLSSQLRQTQKLEAIGTLAGGIAHDFNNILSAIFGYAELGQLETNEITTPYFKEIHKAAIRAKDLVKQILTFSRQADQEKRPVEVHIILKEALKLLKPSTPSTIEVKVNIHSECGYIYADPTQIHQVIMNLFTNAIHAMGENTGTLDVILEPITIENNEAGLHTGDYMQLIIADTGHGIPPEVQAKIFDPYFTTKSVDEGTGLGLSVAHGIVTSLGGKITVESAVDKGTSFRILLPIADADKIFTEAGAESIKGGTERILLVDDEESVLQVEKKVLESLGYSVTINKSSLDACNLFKRQSSQFDLVITDQTMPIMTGVDLAREILLITPEIPIILCTGYSTNVDKRKAKALGIKGFALKPVPLSELAELIRKLLDDR